MPWPLLFTTKHDVKNLDTSSNSIQTSIEVHTNEEEEEDNETYNSHELTISEHNSLLTSLNRIYNYWRQIVFNKVRFILTLVFFTMLNVTSRLMCLTRRRTTTTTIRSTSPLSSIITPPLNRRFEEDINHSLTSFLNFNSQIDLPSTETSSMARTLVQQQTPNLNIHQTTSTQDESLSSMTHSVDDSLFYYKPDSTCLLQLLQRFASEPKMSKFQSTSNGYLNNKNHSLSNTFLPINEPEEEINHFNYDKIEPIVTDDVKSNELDNILPATTIDELDEDILLNINSSLNSERHFRRRKRRSSLTKTPSLNGESEPIVTDSIEKIDDNNNNISIQEEKSEEINKNLEQISIENLSLNENNQEKQESNDKITPPNGLRGRRLRYRSYRQASPTTQEPISDETVQFFLPTETPISISPVSPISPPTNVTSPCTSSNALIGGLKRNGSIGTTKKMVRFADSVGRKLEEVQYIQSLNEDDDSNVFSSVKNNLYIPTTFNSEHKPWSFDVALTSKQFYDNPIPKRFFCLYRQPNSEHPDIYLHEIWKSQIKLEHADVRLKSSSTGEQYLYGTVWVTNASFWKNVTVKYSFNRWLNTYEYEAQHRCHSNDFRNIDQFEFSIDIPSDVDRIDFVLRYHVNGQEHWDNNQGKNYTIETESAYTPQTTISLPHDCDFNEMRFY